MVSLQTDPGKSRGSDDFRVAYGQCWEDTDILLEGLDIRPSDTCVSICSGGDNTLAMLAFSPSRVMAIDSNPAQLACLKLRVAAFSHLDYSELLEFMGSIRSGRRRELYRRCTSALDDDTRLYWDQRLHLVDRGLLSVGRFEAYLAAFRKWILPMLSTRDELGRIMAVDPEIRRSIFDRKRRSLRWKLLFQTFFSQPVMSRFGRDVRNFKYADQDIVVHIEGMLYKALVEQSPRENPYLHWIWYGDHSEFLPFVLRLENYSRIRDRLDRLEFRCMSLERFLENSNPSSFDKFNLSNIFEYMSETEFHQVLKEIVRCGKVGGRVAYWNMLVDRRAPSSMQDDLVLLHELVQELERRDRVFFYKSFVLEQIQ